MNRFARSISIAAIATVASLPLAAMAAKPTSLIFTGNAATDDGRPFANYSVKCSNGQSRPLTAWDNRREWCLGEGSDENCHRKQIKAAKEACKAS